MVEEVELVSISRKGKGPGEGSKCSAHLAGASPREPVSQSTLECYEKE